MPTPGYVFKDGGPIPDSELERLEKERKKEQDQSKDSEPPGTLTDRIKDGLTSLKRETSISSSSQPGGVTDAPTDSHVLARATPEETGAAQEQHIEHEVRDLGWSGGNTPKNLIGGLSNDELWLLVRRFDKQMYHLKAMQAAPPGGLDLNIADEDEFSPDKMRANLERLYMTVIVGMTALGKHVARLRSWREPRRTAAFAIAYLFAWSFDFLTPLLLTTFVLLILFPSSRVVLFPPAPIALVSSKTGGIQSPKAGVLGSHDSITGAPEKHQGEAVEQEASNFVAGFATIAMSSAVGKHEPADPHGDALNSSVPDPTNLAGTSADAQSAASGGTPTVEHDKTKQPMEDAMWAKMRPIMHVVGDVADAWERFANALSPTAPFPKILPRLKLAALIIPLLLISVMTSSYMFTKINTFSIGLGFFGDPVIRRALHFLNEKTPDWRKLLEVRNTILKGVPTNAQLTITLLRIGEANRAPIPPPPKSDEPPPSHPASLDKDNLPLEASHEELQAAIHEDEAESTSTDAQGGEVKKRHGSAILGALKGTARAGISTKLGSDKVKAAAGSSSAKNHLGVLPNTKDRIISGPIDFKARYKGQKGWVYINTSATIPCVSFSVHKSHGTGEQTEKELQPVWSIPIGEIKELKKLGGFGWKSKLLVGWATNKSVADGLEIVDKEGSSIRVTAIVLREELFNRLASMGAQKWESW